MLEVVTASLEDDQAADITVIDLSDKSPFADQMVIASGRSARHVKAITEHLVEKLKASGFRQATVEGMPQCDWVLIDAGDIVVHVFRPEVRDFYNLEKMWNMPLPEPDPAGSP